MAVMAWPETMPPIRESLASAGRRIVIPPFPISSTERLRSLTHGANASVRMSARSVFVRPAARPLSEVMETLLAAGHRKQARRWHEPVAARFRQSFAFLRELPGSDAVDIRQHAAVMGRKRPAEHRAEIGVGCARDDAVLHRAYRFDRLDMQKAALNFLHVRSWVVRRIFGGQAGPDGTAAVGLIVVNSRRCFAPRPPQPAAEAT